MTDGEVPGEIHLLERAEGWEVWRRGDSRPLGTYPTRDEAVARGSSQAEADGVAFVAHVTGEDDDGSAVV